MHPVMQETEGRIVSVSSELDPDTQGGAGVLVDTLARHFAGHDPLPEDSLAASDVSIQRQRPDPGRW